MLNHTQPRNQAVQPPLDMNPTCPMSAQPLLGGLQHGNSLSPGQFG